MSEDNPFVDEGSATPAGPVQLMAGGEANSPNTEPERYVPPASGEPSAGTETDEAANVEPLTAPVATDAKPAMKVKTKIEFDITAEPYVPGQCTVILALAIRPDDGHPDGRLVVLGARSHNEAPVLATARLNTLQLPETLTRLLTDYEAQLPRRGALKAEARAKEEAEQKAAEVRRQSSRKGAATAKAKHGTSAKPEAKPDAAKPAAKAASTQVSLFGA
jgi:hypothetical protein